MKHPFLLFALLLIAVPSFAEADTAPDDSPRLVVERIEIIGATKTRETVIRHHLSFAANDSIDADILAADLQVLKNTNFFKEVAIYTRPGNERGRLRVEIVVKERYLPGLYFEGGHAEFDGWYLSPLGIRFDNLLGRGNHAGIKTYISQNKIGLQGFYANNKRLHPVLQYYLSLFADVHHGFHDIDGIMYYQPVAIIGMRVNITPAKLFPCLSVGLGIQHVVPEKYMINFDDEDAKKYELPPEVKRSSDAATPLRLSLVASKDTRDNSFYPSRGFWGQAVYDFVNDVERGAYRYHQLMLDGRLYHPLGPGTGAMRLKLATTQPSAPFYDRFYLGGSYSLRGYEEYSLTPLGWGTQLALLNLEYRLPLSKKGYPRHRWTAAVFADAGAIRRAGEDDAVQRYSALGLGLRIRLPIIGLLRIDTGFPLQHGEALMTFSIGNMF